MVVEIIIEVEAEPIGREVVAFSQSLVSKSIVPLTLNNELVLVVPTPTFPPDWKIDDVAESAFPKAPHRGKYPAVPVALKVEVEI